MQSNNNDATLMLEDLYCERHIPVTEKLLA